MPTPQQCLTYLIELDTALVNEYAGADEKRRTAINRCRSAIESTLHEMIRQKLQERDEEIKSLTAALDGATQTLKELASAVKRVASLLKTITAIVNAASRVSGII